ncbi:MAG: hypothetical protein ACI9IT_001674, partial [Glaciecola sp.]
NRTISTADLIRTGGINKLAINIKRKKPLYISIQRLFYFYTANLVLHPI